MLEQLSNLRLLCTSTIQNLTEVPEAGVVVQPEDELISYTERLNELVGAVRPFLRAKLIRDIARCYGADTEIVKHECKLCEGDFGAEILEENVEILMGMRSSSRKSGRMMQEPRSWRE